MTEAPRGGDGHGSGCTWADGRGPGVALFVSTFINKIDRKGRVSVPAPFRAASPARASPASSLFPAVNSRAIEGSGIDRHGGADASASTQLPEFSDERDALSAIFADAQQLPFDSEGRIILPPRADASMPASRETGAPSSATAAPSRFGSRRASSSTSTERERARASAASTLPPRGRAGGDAT